MQPLPKGVVVRTASAGLPDPLSRYSAPLFNGFVKYLRWYLKRHFHSVLVSLRGLPNGTARRPLIIYSNHPSWWDPLIFMQLHVTFFSERRGYGPMEAQSLQRYAILERFGAFGIDLDSARGGVLFMVLAKRILADHRSILWLTVEGAFTDVRQRPIHIRRGLGYLARTVPHALIIPLAIEYPFWNESRPEAVCRFGEPIDPQADGFAHRSVDELNASFEAALAHTMDELSKESQQRDATLFSSLLKGRAGVGGVYDGWRRLRSWARGARFDASHEQPK